MRHQPSRTDLTVISLLSRARLTGPGRPPPQVLNVNSCHRITDAGVCQVTRSCKRLQLLDVGECLHVSDVALLPLQGERLAHPQQSSEATVNACAPETYPPRTTACVLQGLVMIVQQAHVAALFGVAWLWSATCMWLLQG